MHTITGKKQKLYDSVFREELSKEEDEKWKTYYKKAFKGGYFEIEDHYYNAELKETQYGQTTFEPLKNDDNKIFAVACRWKNVTSIIKHRNEENQLMDASLDVFCTFNADGEFVYASEASKKHWGYAPEELIGKRYIEMTLAEDVSKTEEIATAIESGQATKTFYNRFRKKDGGIAYNLWSSRWDDTTKLFYAVARDNQEQVEQEEKIKQSEKRFKALVQEGSDIYALIDKAGNYIYMSPSSISIIGIPPEEFIGKDAFEYLHPDDIESARESLKKAVTQDKVFMEHYRAKNHKNEWRWVETVLTNMLNNPAVKGIVVNSTDITEKIEQEQKIQRSQKRFESLVENSMDCVIIISPEGNTTYVSGSVKKVLGYSPAEVMGMNFSELVHPEDLPHAENALLLCLNNPGVPMKGYTSRVKHKDGSWRWIEALITNLLDDPSVMGIVDNFRDITEQVEEKRHLKLLESVITNTNDAVLITEAGVFDEPGPKIIYVNEAFTKMTGYAAVEVIGKTPRILQGPKSDKEELAKLSKAIRNWEPYEITTINYKKSGEEFCINYAVTPVFDEKGWYTHWIAIARDVTESIEAKEKLIRAKELAEENERKMNEAQKLAHLGSWYYDVINKVSEWSEETYNIWGLNPETTSIDLVDHQKLVHPKDWERFNAVINDATEKGIPYKMELELIMPNGSSKIVNTIGEPIFNEKNQVIAFRGTTQDITERKTIENELRNAKEKAEESEYSIRVAGSMAKIGYWAYDKKKDLISWSDEIHKIYGTNIEKGVPNLDVILSFFTEKSKKEIVEATIELASKGTPYELELNLINSKNENIWIRNLGHPVYNEQNEMVGRRGVSQNITAEKNTQLALLKAKEKAESSQNTMNQVSKLAKIGYWEYDAIADKVTWSSYLYEIFGLDPEKGSPTQKEIVKYFDDESKIKLKQSNINLNTKGISYEIEIKIINAQNNEVWVRNVVQPTYNTKNEIIGRKGLVQNITDSKLLQFQLELSNNNLEKSLKKVEESEQSMTQASEFAKIGYWYYDSIKQTLKWSDYIYELYNLTPEDDTLSYEDAKGHFDGQSQEKITKANKELDENGTPYDIEIRMINSKDDELWIRNVVQPVYNDQNKIIGRRGLLQNITEEKSLRDLNDDVSKMVRIGSWSVDLEKNTVFWSEPIHLLHETDSKSYVPNLEEGINFYREDFRQMVQSEVENTIKTGEGWDFEAVIVTAKKNERWIRSIGNAEFSNGKCVRLYGGFQDIDHRKQYENRLVSLSENLPGIIYEYYIQPDGTNLLKNISGKVEEIWGFTAKEIMDDANLVWAQIDAGGKMEEVNASIRKAIETKSRWQYQFKYMMPKTGKLHTHLGFGTPSFLADGTIMFNAIILDVTKEAKNEVLLEQTSKLARIGSWEMDLISQEGDSMYWSPSIMEILEIDDKNYTPTLQEGIEFHIGQSQDRIKKALQLLIEEGIEFDEEILLRTAKGTQRWCRAIGKSEVINNVRVKIYGSYQDIHELKTANLSLKKNIKALEDYKYSLDQSAIIAFTDQKGIITSVNDNFIKISGYGQNELIGKTHRILNANYHPKSFFTALWKTIASGNVWRGEIKNKAKDGSYYWVDTTIVPFLNEKNKPTQYLAIRFDITERKKAEERLIYTSDQLRLATTSAKMGIWDWDVVNDNLIWDDRMYELYGVKEEDFEGAVVAWTNGIHPDDVERATKDLYDAVNGIRDFNTVFRVVWPDKSIHYIEGTAIVSRDKEGNAERMIGGNIDITDIKKAEQEILEAKEKVEASEAKFKSYTEKSPVAIYTTNTDGDCNYVNETWLKMTGMNHKEALGKGWLEALHPDDLEDVNINWYKSISSKGRWSFEYRFINKKTKEITWVEGTAKQMFNNNNELIGYLGTNVDVTERKKSKEKIEASEAKFRSYTEKSPFVIYTTNIEGECTFLNETWTEISGLGIEESLGKGWMKVLHPDDVDLVNDNWFKSVESRGKFKYEYRYIHEKDKRIVWVEGTAKEMLNEKNELIGFIGTIIDITDRKKAEFERTRFQETIENSLNEIYIFDAETFQFDYVNNGALLNLGYSLEEIKKLTPIDIAPDYPKLSFNQLVAPLKNNELEKVILFSNHKRKDGTLYPVEVHLQLVKQENNSRFLAIILDLTERKKAEDMYRLLANNTNDIIALQNDNFSFTFISPAVETLLGYKPIELLDKKIFNIIHEEDIVIITEALKDKLFKGKTVKSILFRARHKKGHFIWLESLLSPIIEANRIVSIVSSTRDITKAVNSKNKIQEYQSSLQKLTKEISLIEEKQKKEIAANIHDHLSQSLVISKMRVADLQKNTSLNNFQKDLEFINSHISEALENSRKITYELSPPILYQLGLIDAIDWFLDETKEKYGINCLFNSNVDSIDLSEFKSILLFRCIQEAVTNTIKYAEASLITLNLKKDEETVTIVIVDDGKGFDTSKLNNSVNSGSGFGLFAVKERVRNMNGELHIDSEINIGTKIKIYVPLAL